jgi:hypothetical protein
MWNLTKRWLGDVKRCAALLVALAFLKGLVFIALTGLGRTEPFIGTNAKEIVFPIADRIVNQHRFNGADSRSDSKMPPGYPFLVALLKATHVPHIPVVMVVFQMLADALTALCLLAFGHLMSNVMAGGLAGVIWSLYPLEIGISTWITQEPIFTTLLIASLVLVLATLRVDKRTLLLSLAAGALMGLATLFRATPLMIPAALAPAWIWKRKFADALVFIAAMGLFIVAWTIRNAAVLDDGIVVATGTGSVFLLGSDDDQVYTTEKKNSFFSSAAAEGRRNGILKPYPEYESAIDHWLFRLGLMRYRERLHTRPLSFLKLFVVKFLRLWYTSETAHARAELLLGLCALPFVPIGLWQVWRWRKSQMACFLVCGGVLAYFIAMHVVLLPLARYALPIHPLLILASAYWLCSRIGGMAPAGSSLS